MKRVRSVVLWIAAWGQRIPLQQLNCALFFPMWLYFCWVMICPVTTCRPTQTQGHTHHDTVESVWLGSRSTCRRGGGKNPKTWLMSLSLSLPFFFPSLPPSVYPSLALSLSLSVTSPSLSICRYCHSPLFFFAHISIWGLSCRSAPSLCLCKTRLFHMTQQKQKKNVISIHNLVRVSVKCTNKLDDLLVFKTFSSIASTVCGPS